MEKEIIELLKTVVGSSETLIGWYMGLLYIREIVFWPGMAFLMWAFGKGMRKVLNHIDKL